MDRKAHHLFTKARHTRTQLASGSSSNGSVRPLELLALGLVMLSYFGLILVFVVMRHCRRVQWVMVLALMSVLLVVALAFIFAARVILSLHSGTSRVERLLLGPMAFKRSNGLG